MKINQCSISWNTTRFYILSEQLDGKTSCHASSIPAPDNRHGDRIIRAAWLKYPGFLDFLLNPEIPWK